MTDDDLKAARALCDAATPGPWHRVDDPWGSSDWVCATKSLIGDPHGGVPVADCDMLTDEDGNDPPVGAVEANAAFIAAARTLLPAALDEIERLRNLCTEQASQLLDPDATCCADASRVHKEQRLEIEHLRETLKAHDDWGDQHAARGDRYMAEVKAMRPVVLAALAVIDAPEPWASTPDVFVALFGTVAAYRRWLDEREGAKS